MAKPLELRRSRRTRRIDRTKPFAERNHREKRFNNRRQGKIPPNILSNRQMELRVLSEMSLILPIAKICDEDCGGNTARNVRGLSPVTVGQEWFRFCRGKNHGHELRGVRQVTLTPFIVVTRRKLHQEQYSKGGVLKSQGGTITPFGFRSGDYVETTRKGQFVRGWIGGFTDSQKTKNVSVYDHNWSRIGQFNPKNVRLLSRSSRLCLAV